MDHIYFLLVLERYKEIIKNCFSFLKNIWIQRNLSEEDLEAIKNDPVAGDLGADVIKKLDQLIQQFIITNAALEQYDDHIIENYEVGADNDE